jgi:K+-transporting ATPase KdpF subunit
MRALYEDIPMLELILAGLIALALLIYLVYSMLYPEKF